MDRNTPERMTPEAAQELIERAADGCDLRSDARELRRAAATLAALAQRVAEVEETNKLLRICMNDGACLELHARIAAEKARADALEKCLRDTARYLDPRQFPDQIAAIDRLAEGVE